ncbi:hypothetical protein DPMN_038067 [Dreissena polymorpha]|uniref:Uncharacterized protein n=1 Tax=Dreissena polymorpha TaxID=45954 RepID=A0A9D4RNC1_DREPO|nr:hypothetical protein DPMN_038067 [Dreissena polymorpha]
MDFINYTVCGMPGVVGAVDGSHSACPAPTSEHRSLFINSLVLQAVCDSRPLLEMFGHMPWMAKFCT